MRIHLSCSHPTRTRVLAMHSARELLASAGHELSVSWPEGPADEDGAPNLQVGQGALDACEVFIHVGDGADALVRDLRDVLGASASVVVYQVGESGAEPPAGMRRVERLEELVQLVGETAVVE